MARIARIIIPNIPHHVTQRGTRKTAKINNQKEFVYQNFSRFFAYFVGIS